MQTTFDQLASQFERDYVKARGWEPGRLLAIDHRGRVVAAEVVFKTDEEGNIYYEILEE